MDTNFDMINGLLVETFNDISHIEESSLRDTPFSDISTTEMHTLEAIGMYEPKPMSEVAKLLGVTVGTLTVAVNGLVRKEYVQRYRIESDRRVVKIGLSHKGRLAYRVHEQFHINMIKATTTGLTNEEESVLAKALDKLNKFLKQKYLQIRAKN